MYQKLKNCVNIIRKKTDFKPKTAIVLGSGLGGYAHKLRVEAEVSYREIEGFPVSTVAWYGNAFRRAASVGVGRY